jgi:UPF0716 family protein affecting phage T7 exclusion
VNAPAPTPYQPPAEPPVTRAQGVVTFAVTLALFLVGGAVCAAVWAAVVEPPTFSPRLPMFAGEPVPNVEGLDRTFNIDATFLLTAGAGAVVLGALCGALFRSYGVVTVLAVLAGSGVGYLTMRHLGIGLGPEALAAQARGAGAHAALLAPLRVQATGVYFAWPIGALAGVMAALWALAPDPQFTQGQRSDQVFVQMGGEMPGRQSGRQSGRHSGHQPGRAR